MPHYFISLIHKRLKLVIEMPQHMPHASNIIILLPIINAIITLGYGTMINSFQTVSLVNFRFNGVSVLWGCDRGDGV